MSPTLQHKVTSRIVALLVVLLLSTAWVFPLNEKTVLKPSKGHPTVAPKPATPRFSLRWRPANDPIRFSIRVSQKNVALGQPVELTITAQYLSLSPALLYTVAGSNSFRLKLLVPDGFVRTGGDYADLVTTELSPAKPSVSFTVTGYFTRPGTDMTFRLLRSHANADASSLFVDKARLALQLINSPELVQKSQARISANPANGNYEGNCDGGHCGDLWGWVYDRNNPNARITIEMLANGQVVGTLTASEFRQDLLNAGKGNGQHGFGFPLPESIKNGQSQNLTLRVQGSNYILPNSTRTLTCAGSGGTPTQPTNPTPTTPTTTNPSNGNYEGYFDGAHCENLWGWVYDRNNPNTPLTLELLANNQVISSFVAGEFRQDLQNAGKGNGQHGFNYAPPAAIKNGQNQSLTLRVQGSNFTLNNGPKSIQCAGSGSGSGTGTNPNPTSPSAGACSVGDPKGHLDGVDDIGFWGWALDHSDLNKTVTVDIFVDGVKVGSVVANENRDDLVGAFGNNPAARYHGFSGEWIIKTLVIIVRQQL